MIDDSQRQALLDEIVIVHVPPIRDLAAGGLDPFKATMAAAIRKTRGDDSFPKLNNRVREAIKKSGNTILSSTQASAKSLLNVDGLSVDVNLIELDDLLPMAGITFKVQGRESSLDKLGTGHQSSVILSLYRQLGSTTGKFVLYLFEEPDNHLHPTSLRAIADELKISLSANAQAFITTHSPYFLNQFPVSDWLPLTLDPTRSTVLRVRNLALLSSKGIAPERIVSPGRRHLPSEMPLLRTRRGRHRAKPRVARHLPGAFDLDHSPGRRH